MDSAQKNQPHSQAHAGRTSTSLKWFLWELKGEFNDFVSRIDLIFP